MRKRLARRRKRMRTVRISLCVGIQASPEFGFADVFWRTEYCLDDFRSDGDFTGLTAGKTCGDGAADGLDLAFEFAHAGFVGVIADDFGEGGRLESTLFGAQAVFLELRRGQITEGGFHL